MPDERGVTHYDAMPIPPVAEHTTYFEAGAIRIGVEYRLLDEAIAAVSAIRDAHGKDSGPESPVEDRGVSLHVFGESNGESLEFIRFDCFHEDPHYHYICWPNRTNQMIHIDPVVTGDPLEWALHCLRHRLREMLIKAGAEKIAATVENQQIEDILPRIAEAAYRARFDHDEIAIRSSALSGVTP